jgi:hypothetical protein
LHLESTISKAIHVGFSGHHIEHIILDVGMDEALFVHAHDELIGASMLIIQSMEEIPEFHRMPSNLTKKLKRAGVRRSGHS